MKVLCVGGPWHGKVIDCNKDPLPYINYCVSNDIGFLEDRYILTEYRNGKTIVKRSFYIDNGSLQSIGIPCSFSGAEQYILETWDDSLDKKEIKFAIG